MGIVRGALILIGALAILIGLLWIGQGLGLVHWPASSFMIDQRIWAYRGLTLTGLGLMMVLIARRIGGVRGR